MYAVVPNQQQNNPYVGVADRYIGHPNSYLRVRWRGWHRHEQYVVGLDNRVAATADMFGAFFSQVTQIYGPSIARVLIYHPDGMAILNNRRDFVVHGHFDNVNTFPYDFEVGLTEALDNLTNSNGDLDVTDLEFELMVTKILENRAGTKITTIARNAIGNGNAGLFSESGAATSLTECCGWIALLRALVHNAVVRQNWIGDLSWLTYDLKDPRETFRKKKLMKKLVASLKLQLGITEDIWELQPAEGLSTQAKVIAAQPKLLIVIMDQGNKLRLFRERGAEWTMPAEGRSATVFMSFNPDFTKKNNVGHLQGISSIWRYLNISAQVKFDEYMWCDFCVCRHARTFECEARRFVCDGCGFEFHDDDTLLAH